MEVFILIMVIGLPFSVGFVLGLLCERFKL